MNNVRLLFLFAAVVFFGNYSFAQVHLKVEAIAGTTNTYGVYAKVCDNIMPSGNTITGSGQVTLIYPSGMTFSSLTPVAGLWMQNAMVTNPSEAPGKVYVSMGFVNDVPQIIYQPDTETLLFTFQLNGNGTGTPSLIVNGIDPFDHLPNSVSSNPGNELTILDFGVQPLGLYTYEGNYTGSSVDCSNIPQDTTTQDTTIITPPGDTTTQDTTIITPPGDTTTQDTTIITPPGDTTTQDTTIITPPGDTTNQTSGVRDLNKKSDYFTLYPTPAFEWVTVKFLSPSTEGGTIKLFTMNGIALGEIQRGQKQELTLNISGLSSGFYLIRYDKDGKTLQRGKFLKQ
ncbi:MAG: T9SS type A sorting domain-containing protein [Bacteroidetes bacterium]|nr:T9SS type A sorting domain-containing protein [Bacteroidota bacterium]